MSARTQTLLWIGQRASAALLALCVLVHLATIIFAVRGGLSAAEILGRTQGNLAWLSFYIVFVLAIAIHVPIGLRTILAEWFAWRSAGRDVALVVFSLFLLIFGLRTVFGVFG